MTIDAAEIARLRKIAGKATQDRWHSKSALETAFYSQDAFYIATFHPPKVLAILDELEKAQADGQRQYEHNVEQIAKFAAVEAERDSARALLRTSDAIFENTRGLLRASVPGPNYRASSIAQAIDDHRARIAAELGDKP